MIWKRDASGVDVLCAQVNELQRQVAQLTAEVATLRAEARAAIAVTATGTPTTAGPSVPETADMRPIWMVIDAIAPEEGPMRRHLIRTAAGMLRAPDASPEFVADILSRGSEDDA